MDVDARDQVRTCCEEVLTCLRFGAVFRRDDQGAVIDAPRIPNESVWNGGSLSPVELTVSVSRQRLCVECGAWAVSALPAAKMSGCAGRALLAEKAPRERWILSGFSCA